MSNETKVVNIDSKRPHLAGKAHCLDCGQEEVAVAPIGVHFMECSKCRGEKMVYRNPVEIEGEHWRCNCGGMLFAISAGGNKVSAYPFPYCIVCGAEQRGWLK